MQATGFTQLELLISIAILGILATFAVPSFRSTLERNDIIAVAEALSADLRWARGEAIKRNAAINVTFTPGAAGVWHYVISTDASILKHVSSAQSADFKAALAENFRNHSTTFDPVRGTNEGKNGTATLTSAQGTYRLKVILGNLGRVRICADLGGIGGYDACS
jgi:prepilin-type N-terminal cleavage/methylation domain-containing protein